MIAQIEGIEGITFRETVYLERALKECQKWGECHWLKGCQIGEAPNGFEEVFLLKLDILYEQSIWALTDWGTAERIISSYNKWKHQNPNHSK